MITYAQALIVKAQCEERVRTTGATLKAFSPGNGALTPDHVKATPEYRKAYAAYHAAFQILRASNAVFVKQFKAEIKQSTKGEPT